MRAAFGDSPIYGVAWSAAEVLAHGRMRSVMAKIPGRLIVDLFSDGIVRLVFITGMETETKPGDSEGS